MLTRGQSKAKCLPLARQGHYIGNQCKVCPIWCCGKRLWCHRWRNALTTSIRVTQQLSCMTENLPYVIQKSTNLSLLWICLVLSLWEDDCLGLIRYSQLVPSRFKQGERPSPPEPYPSIHNFIKARELRDKDTETHCDTLACSGLEHRDCSSSSSRGMLLLAACLSVCTHAIYDGDIMMWERWSELRDIYEMERALIRVSRSKSHATFVARRRMICSHHFQIMSFVWGNRP